jgi:hypothetical protein
MQFAFFLNNIQFVDDADKWLYNFASVAMESAEELAVESIEIEPLAVPPSQPHKNLLGGGLASPNRRIMLFALPFLMLARLAPQVGHTNIIVLIPLL